MLARKALAGTAGAPKVYVEDVFSTYLWDGNATARNIVNGIDLSGEGGMVWTKYRNTTNNHRLYDTARGATKEIYTSLTNAESTASQSLTAFNADGFSLGTGQPNENTATVVGWTFRKAKKFFDVVTYTGNGTTKTISHNLGSTPGCIIVKESSASGNDWQVYHRSTTNTCGRLFLNLTNAENANNRANTWGDNTNPIPPTSTEFTVGNTGGVNNNGATYVAYLFAHDAGGFGDAGSDNVISCGSFTTNGSGYFDVNLGYEPQWLLFKKSSGTGDWFLADNMRGMGVQALAPPMLSANTSAAETTANGSFFYINSTGFGKSNNADLGANSTYIYIAIRRGPMKTPTTGTSVYNAIVRDGTAATATITGVGFPVDLIFTSLRPAGTHNPVLSDRLRGAQKTLSSRGTQEEQTETAAVTSFASMDGVSLGADNTGFWNGFNSSSGSSYVNWFFKRAPGFFDVVCYTGDGVNGRSLNHNLGVAPELMIIKRRSGIRGWVAASSAAYYGGSLVGYSNSGYLNTDAAFLYSSITNSTNPTSTVFTIGSDTDVNGSGSTYVAYLFASLSGVSKVGSYTGNGSSVTVTTNFQPRFILVKRTDSTGNWIVSDSARGLVSGSDPALFLNTTDAETTGQDWVDVSSTSFTVNETALNANVNTATYLYLAVA